MDHRQQRPALRGQTGQAEGSLLRVQVGTHQTISKRSRLKGRSPDVYLLAPRHVIGQLYIYVCTLLAALLVTLRLLLMH